MQVIKDTAVKTEDISGREGNREMMWDVTLQ